MKSLSRLSSICLLVSVAFTGFTVCSVQALALDDVRHPGEEISASIEIPAFRLFPLAQPATQISCPTDRLGGAPAPERPYLHAAPVPVINRLSLYREASSELPSQQAEWRSPEYTLRTEVGELQVSGTERTITDISRRGGRFSIAAGSDGSSLRLQTFALAGGAKSPRAAGQILGVAGELGFFNDSARLKTVFVSGRQLGVPAGSRRSVAGSRSDVLGVLATVAPPGGALKVEAEFDRSALDANLADGVGEVVDSACRVRVGGEVLYLRYQGAYELVGPRYGVIWQGSEGRDREGVSLSVSRVVADHTLGLSYASSHTNTERSAAYPRQAIDEGGVDYSYNGIARVPVGFQYRKRLAASSDEPVGSVREKSETDMVTGRVSYQAGAWDFGASTSYSLRYNRLLARTEESTVKCAVSPRYKGDYLSLAPDLSLSRTENTVSGAGADICQLSVDISGRLPGMGIGYQLGGHVKGVVGTPPSAEKSSFATNFMLNYPLQRFLPGFRLPSLGIRSSYSSFSEQLLDREFLLMLTIGSS